MTLRERIGRAVDQGVFVGCLVVGLAVLLAGKLARRRASTRVDGRLVRKAGVGDSS